MNFRQECIPTIRIGCDDMKIEKINDNQIRCTLTKEDLESTPYPHQRTGLWYRQSQAAVS